MDCKDRQAQGEDKEWAPTETFYFRAGKRALDLCAAVVGLVFLAPFLFMVGVAVRLSSPGKVLYRQLRAGLNGRPFEVIKFRTMGEGMDVVGPYVTSRDDPRVTSVGRFLRNWKIDELPQLWNILVGDMSLVGPRPDTLEHVAQYPLEYRRALCVHPGLTSLASVCHRDEDELFVQAGDKEQFYLAEILPRKMILNVRYVSNVSLALDLKILALTAILIFLPGTSRDRTIRLFGRGFSPFSRPFQLLIDFCIFLGALYLSYFLRFEGSIPYSRRAQLALLAIFLPPLRWAINRIVGVYDSVWRHFSHVEALILAGATSIISLLLLALRWWVALPPEEFPYLRVPLGVIALEYFLVLSGMVSVRLLRKLLYQGDMRYRPAKALTAKRILIAGAGRTGLIALRELSHSPEFEVLGFVDDDPRKVGMRVYGLKVIDTINNIPYIVRTRMVDTVLLCLDTPDSSGAQRVQGLCSVAGVPCAVFPDIARLVEGATLGEVWSEG